MTNRNGFTFIEVLIASSIFFSFLTVTVPIVTLITKEQALLQDRQKIAVKLHEELQFFLWEDHSDLPVSDFVTIHTKRVNLVFTKSNFLIKGCATWENARQKEESICLYGHIPE